VDLGFRLPGLLLVLGGNSQVVVVGYVAYFKFFISDAIGGIRIATTDLVDAYVVVRISR
jgi:hypothetical protein